jgi:hypothetical protein
MIHMGRQLGHELCYMECCFNFLIFYTTLSVPDEGYSRYASCALHLISTFLLLSLGQYLCSWTISPGGYHLASISVSALKWRSTYICYSNLQFLNNVIFIKTKVLLPQAYVTLTDFGDSV